MYGLIVIRSPGAKRSTSAPASTTHAAEVDTEDRGQRDVVGGMGMAEAHPQIPAVHRRRLHAHEQVARTRDRIRNLLDLEHLGAAEPVHANRSQSTSAVTSISISSPGIASAVTPRIVWAGGSLSPVTSCIALPIASN